MNRDVGNGKGQSTANISSWTWDNIQRDMSQNDTITR